MLALHADSAFVDSVVASKHVQIAPDARVRIRRMAREPVMVSDSAPLVTWNGGMLTPEAARRATLMLDPANRSELVAGSDSLATRYLSDVVKWRIIVDAVAPKPVLTPEIRAFAMPRYKASVNAMRRRLASSHRA